MANCRYLQIPFPFLTYISPSVLSMGIVGRKIVTRRTAQFSTFNLPSRKLGEGLELNGHLPPPMTSDSQEWIWICEHKRGYTGFLRAFGRVQTAGSVVAFSGARFYLQCTMYKVLFRSYLLLYILPNEVYQIVSAKIQHLYLCTKFRKKNLQKLRIEEGASIVTTPLPARGEHRTRCAKMRGTRAKYGSRK